jgi:hypothetical protein
MFFLINLSNKNVFAMLIKRKMLRNIFLIKLQVKNVFATLIYQKNVAKHFFKLNYK